MDASISHLSIFQDKSVTILVRKIGYHVDFEADNESMDLEVTNPNLDRFVYVKIYSLSKSTISMSRPVFILQAKECRRIRLMVSKRGDSKVIYKFFTLYATLANPLEEIPKPDVVFEYAESIRSSSIYPVFFQWSEVCSFARSANVKGRYSTMHYDLDQDAIHVSTRQSEVPKIAPGVQIQSVSKADDSTYRYDFTEVSRILRQSLFGLQTNAINRMKLVNETQMKLERLVERREPGDLDEILRVAIDGRFTAAQINDVLKQLKLQKINPGSFAKYLKGATNSNMKYSLMCALEAIDGQQQGPTTPKEKHPVVLQLLPTMSHIE